jgi:DnaJ-class molecular chaperone
MKDYYLILKIPRDSSAEDIRKAHRRQFLRYHPDRSTEPDPTRFREAQEAYDVLRDQEKRRDYNDRLKDHEDRLHTHPEPVHRGPMSLWEEFGTVLPDIGEILDHIRRDFFGPIRKVEPLRELNVEFILNPDEASCGGSLPLDVPVYEDCPRCDGRGGAFPFPCLLCDGKGWSWGKRTISVRIPPGVQDGTVMQIPLQKLGIEHLYLNVYIRIQPH